MSENTKLWDILGRTDPKQTKAFTRGGGFKGTAIKPIWSFRRMTEEFGPCGVGWGVGEPSFQVVPGENREVLVYCTASIWYRSDDKEARVYGVGGDKVVTHIKANEQYKRPERWDSDDEAFKKAFTDAVTNALKLIGVGADVHMGLFEDNKYVRDMADEFSEQPRKQPAENAQPVQRTSSAALKRDDIWAQMLHDISECRSVVSLQKCRFIWAGKAVDDRWPQAWRDAAVEEFDQAEKALNQVARMGAG